MVALELLSRKSISWVIFGQSSSPGYTGKYRTAFHDPGVCAQHTLLQLHEWMSTIASIKLPWMHTRHCRAESCQGILPDLDCRYGNISYQHSIRCLH